jgi:oxygen-dependent protoporphyrinogen oxidase
LSHGEVLSSRALIIATPAPVTAGLLRGVDGILAEALSQIPYASSAIVCLGYRTSDVPHPLLGYGYVIPRAEGRPALACTWVSSKFEHRAPAGFSLLRVFLGRAGEDEVTRQPDTVLANLARHELRSTLHVETEPLLTRIYRWPQAMPQYTLGHTNRLRTIAQRLETLPGLLLAGNAYRGVGIPDCIRSGEDAAQRVIDGSGLQPGTRAR